MEKASIDAVIHASAVLQRSATTVEKLEAHSFLDKFQKQSEAWMITLAILGRGETPVEVRLFAATTLKGKITYDLEQLEPDRIQAIRDDLLHLLTVYAQGPRPIRLQLCVCLAILAIQMLSWHNAVEEVGRHLAKHGEESLLDFLTVLPEEALEGRKINLTVSLLGIMFAMIVKDHKKHEDWLRLFCQEDEYASRCRELLESNTDLVFDVLIKYSQSSMSSDQRTKLVACINSWLREIPAARIVGSTLLDTILQSLVDDKAFDSCVECICNLCYDTRDVDDSLVTINLLYPRILELRTLITGRSERLKGLTRIFADAGEAWVVLLVRSPDSFSPLVDAILECCSKDQDRDAISQSFHFWDEFKQMLTMGRYQSAREVFAPAFDNLVDVMISHLQFPIQESESLDDLFDGDRELEEKFREFRHHMGDVLKDCCEVIDPSRCLSKCYELMRRWAETYSNSVSSNSVPSWQILEAVLFAIRAMGLMVPADETTILPKLMPLVTQIPKHVKLQFQAIMAIARYTEWTANNPEYLQQQFMFVTESLSSQSQEVIDAAALAFRFFGTDCGRLLVQELTAVQHFYNLHLDGMSLQNQEELTEGVSGILAYVPNADVHQGLKLCCDPVLERLKHKANLAKSEPNKNSLTAVADKLRLLDIFLWNVCPPYVQPESNEVVRYCQELFPILSLIVETFADDEQISEQVARCWRSIILKHKTAVLPLLPEMTKQIANGFHTSHHGCYLRVTDAILREFSHTAAGVDAKTSKAVYDFFENQAFAFLDIFQRSDLAYLAEAVEDFYHCLIDVVIYYPNWFLMSAICTPVLGVAINALGLQQKTPVMMILHYLQDLCSYGTSQPSHTNYHTETQNTLDLTSQRRRVIELLTNQGEALTQRLLSGMLFSFPPDCIQDSAGILLTMFRILPSETSTWIHRILSQLPSGSVKAGEADRLLALLSQKIQADETRKVRTLLHDFTLSYRRRNVTPREGI